MLKTVRMGVPEDLGRRKRNENQSPIPTWEPALDQLHEHGFVDIALTFPPGADMFHQVSHKVNKSIREIAYFKLPEGFYFVIGNKNVYRFQAVYHKPATNQEAMKLGLLQKE